jgi:hypothetical protein
MRTAFAVCALVLVTVPAAGQDLACPYRAGSDLSARASPLDSTSFTVAGHTVKICYGRPSLRGRTMLGGEAVPWGKVWRTGANETTKFITTAPVMVGTLAVPAGMYALYTVPGERQWEIIINRSYEQWGRENTYTDSVKALELGRVQVTADSVASPIERFTIRSEPQPDGTALLVLEWQHSRAKVPIRAQ